MKRKYFLALILSFLFYVPDCICQANLNQGLIAYYPFSGNANDASGNGLNGIPRNGVQLTTDKFGNPNSAYYFDGVDDYIEVLDDPKLRFRDSFSISLLFNRDPTGSQTAELIEKRLWADGSASSFDFGLVNAAQVRTAVKTGDNCPDPLNGWIYPTVSNSTLTDQWYCVVATFNQGLVNFYLDGTLIGSSTTAPKIDSCVGSSMRIGIHLSFDMLPFKGKIDEVRIYNRALNQQDVNALCVLCNQPQGSINGNTVCSGATGMLTYNSTVGIAPFTVQYSDGTNTYTQNNVADGIPFAVTNNPTTTTTYTLLSVTDATGCSRGVGFVSGVTQIVVNSCGVQSCDNWLHIHTNADAVLIGDLDVPGNTITVEAQVNLSLYNPLWGQDVVSKHNNPADANYLLRQNHAEITTSDGFFSTPLICDDSINKTYHLAMVYDGSTLKYYRNGFLLSSVPCTGNMIQNNWNTTIGNYAFNLGQDDETMWGYINEVRIWNVARTQSQIKTYMNTSLPNPTTQPGLLAYYQFNDLLNKQGNAAWNGTIAGSALINQTNPNCNFIADSCCQTIVGHLTGNTICKGAQPLLTFITAATTGPFTLTYSNGIDTLTSTNIQNNVPFVLSDAPSKSTKYILLSIKDTTNCAPTNVVGDTAIITINSLPKGYLTGDDICTGDDAILLFTSTSGSPLFNISYSANGNAYTQSGVDNNSTFTVPFQLNSSTSFTLTSITDANGCAATLDTSASINVLPLPQGGLTDATACTGDSAGITFNASIGTGPFEVEISDGTNSTVYYDVLSGIPFNIAPVTQTTTISLISIIDKDGDGCTRTSGFTSPTATITAKPSPDVEFNPLTAICIQQPAFLITQASETTGIAGNGIFSGDGVDASGNFNPVVAGVGTHKIIYSYTAANGCSAIDSSNINVNPTPIVSAGSDIITCLGFTVQLNATGASTYVWSPAIGLDNAAIKSPVATPDSTTTYIVLGTDSNGCYASDTVTISVGKNGIAAFVVPNAFTPNGDGINDCFGIRRWGGVTVVEFDIFNRWGELIFTTKNPSDCWDGTFKGKLQPTGGYPYIIKAKTPCGDVTRTGIVILAR